VSARSTTGIRRIGPAAALLLVAAVAGAGFAARPAGAAGFDGTFHAEATADALRITVLVPHAPLSNTVMDVGGPSTHAVLDTTGRSEAYASFPYPGDNVVTAPPLIAGASGGKINLPAYPFFVNSSFPSIPKQEAGSGPYAIKAESTDTSSTGSASAGLNSEGQAALGLARSASSTTEDAGSVLSQAATEVTAFAVGPLKIGRVFSTAKTVLGSDGRLTRQADTQITGVMVGDTAVAITPKGLVAGGQSSPLNTAPVHDLLTQAKINVELMPQDNAASGVVAPAVRVTQQDGSGQSGMTAVYLIGAASAFVDGTPASPLASPAGDRQAAPPATAVEPAGPPASSAPTSGSAAAGPPAASAAMAPEPAPADTTTSESATVSAANGPVSFVVPSSDELATGSGAPVTVRPSATAGAAPTAAVLSAAARPAATAATGPARTQLIARLLVSPSDTTPLFGVMAGSMAAALGLLALLARKRKQEV
jgi:hypothetical protein